MANREKVVLWATAKGAGFDGNQVQAAVWVDVPDGRGDVRWREKEQIVSVVVEEMSELGCEQLVFLTPAQAKELGSVLVALEKRGPR